MTKYREMGKKREREVYRHRNGKKIIQHSSNEIARLIKHMVPVATNALAPEESRESQSGRYMIFGNADVRYIFRLTHEEFANLKLRGKTHVSEKNPG